MFLFFPSLLVLVALAGELPQTEATAKGFVQGVVRNVEGPVAGAGVRIKATNLTTLTDEKGRFSLFVPAAGAPLSLTAWAPGHYIGGGDVVQPGQDDLVIKLHRHPDVDHPEYHWVSAFSAAGEAGRCQDCHAAGSGDPPLPFDEWRLDAHSGAATNPRFLSMYKGSHLDGRQGDPTRWGRTRDYGRFPLRRRPGERYYGPGYKLDFPTTAGNCGACHVPAAAIDASYETDPTTASGAAAEGVTCDVCHKVAGVVLDPETGLPFENRPGVMSFVFLRPGEGHQFFAGPLDDVAPGEDVYLPLYRESRYCAPCHFATFWGTVIYNSFGEWLKSPYSDPYTGQTCQDCHMPPGLADHFVRIEKGGHRRDPATIFSHRMPGAADRLLLQSAATLTAKAQLSEGEIAVQVDVTNDKTGHHLPTGSPLRQLILLVQVRDGQGQDLAQLQGPTVPEWGGVGDRAGGYYAGLPGKAFAKVLQEEWTQVSPSGAYWNPTRVLSDTRLEALATDTSTYTFAAPHEGAVQIEVRLLFRRAFIELMDQKGWQVPDILMARQSLVVGR